MSEEKREYPEVRRQRGKPIPPARYSNDTVVWNQEVPTEIAKWYLQKARDLGMTRSDYVNDVLKRHMDNTRRIQAQNRTPL